MASLILEIQTRGLFRYQALERPVTTLGRALDNDVILSDPTVAPHHARIVIHDDGRLEIVNLSDTNPTRVDGGPARQAEASELPLPIELGRVHLRILDRTSPVAETRPLADSGPVGILYRHAAWSIILVIACLVLGGLEFYQSAYNTFKASDLFKFLLRETVLTLGISVLALAILERLIIHRWEIRPLVTSVSLIYLAYFGTRHLADGLDYLLSSTWPGTFLLFGWYLLAIPAAIASYLIFLSHLERGRGIALAVLIASPIAAPGLLQNPRFQVLLDDFSAAARYHSSLSSLNWHLDRRLSIDEFIDQAAALEAGEFAD